jgi:hypothetical protein
MVLEHPIVLECVSDGTEKKTRRRSGQRGIAQALHAVCCALISLRLTLPHPN